VDGKSWLVVNAGTALSYRLAASLEYPSNIVKLRDNARFSTVCIHAGQEPDPSTGAIITPIYQTSTYVQEALGRHKGYEYGRTQNPTRSALEANLAAIENGRAAFAFA
jgi:O-acetylhomoserine/O-acetylserine sulfhydrylase-like pyridoxal-dependent enzyme